MPKWSAEEDRIIREGRLAGDSYEAIAAKLPERTKAAVSLRAWTIGAQRPIEHKPPLHQMRPPTAPARDIAPELDRARMRNTARRLVREVVTKLPRLDRLCVLVELLIEDGVSGLELEAPRPRAPILKSRGSVFRRGTRRNKR